MTTYQTMRESSMRELCYNCLETGHFKHRCPNPPKCNFCKGVNHTTASCCFFCKDNTHSTSQCALHNKCHVCGEAGHTKKGCSRDLKCYKCGRYGHKANACQPRGAITAPEPEVATEGKRCYICNEGGHIAKDCSFNIPEKKDRICNICYSSIGKALIRCCGQRLCRECKKKWFQSHRNFNCPFCRAPHCRSDLRDLRIPED